MRRIKHKKIWLTLIIFIVLLAMVFVGAGAYFFKVACIPGEKSFLSGHSQQIKKSDPLAKEKTWFQKEHKVHWHMRAANGKNKLVANYIPKKSSDKTVIILPGYMDTKEDMGEYAGLFNELGYNSLTPDPRGQGQSEGKYIGYGWPEKNDVKKWTQLVLNKKGKKQQIVIFGVSMGAATAMMASGLKLPKQVKAFVEDCGYSNVKAEIEHEAKVLYNMPAFPRFPLVEILSGINRIKVGYFLNDASSVKQLHKNYRPMMFIHGAKDNFVPTNMVYDNYKATRGQKELWITPKAAHAQSFSKHPQTYRTKVKKFLKKYIK